MGKIHKAAAVLILFIVALGITIAKGQSVSDSKDPSHSLSASSNENEVTKRQYAEDCQKYQLDCRIQYQNGKIENEEEKAQEQPAQKTERSRISSSSEPFLVGPTSVIIVLVLIVGVVLLWLRFGGSGVLLNSSPKEIKPKNEVPESWGKTNTTISKDTKDILSGVLAIDDKRVAMVELLRMCLLHGASISSTRLARSDTERTVFRRLPEKLPQRKELELLLKTTELVHYGGEEISSDQFDALISEARNFLNIRKMANA